MNTLRSASVVGLLLSGCPTAISGGVASIVVNTVDGQRRAVPISKRPIAKGGVIGPLFTDRYSSCSVPNEGFGVAVIATLKHSSPDVPEAGACFTMLGGSSDGAGLLFAATGRRITGSEVWIEDTWCDRPAFTPAVNNPTIPVILSGDMDYLKLAKCLSDGWRNWWISSHSGRLPQPSKSIVKGRL
jgi:hypothetical protein